MQFKIYENSIMVTLTLLDIYRAISIEFAQEQNVFSLKQLNIINHHSNHSTSLYFYLFDCPTIPFTVTLKRIPPWG